MAVPDIAPDEAGEDAPQPIDADGNVIDDAPPPDPEKMTKDAFWQAFSGAFKLGSVMIPGGPIPELAIQTDETDHARAASDASYDLLEAYAPSFLSGGREQLMLFLTAGSFFLMKARIVQAAILARRVAPVSPPQQAGSQPTPTHGPLSADAERATAVWETEVSDDE